MTHSWFLPVLFLGALVLALAQWRLKTRSRSGPSKWRLHQPSSSCKCDSDWSKTQQEGRKLKLSYIGPNLYECSSSVLIACPSSVALNGIILNKDRTSPGRPMYCTVNEATSKISVLLSRRPHGNTIPNITELFYFYGVYWEINVVHDFVSTFSGIILILGKGPCKWKVFFAFPSALLPRFIR